MDVKNVTDQENDEAVLHTLDLIRRWQGVLKTHQSDPEYVSELAVQQYTRLINELTADLVELLKERYGLTLQMQAINEQAA